MEPISVTYAIWSNPCPVPVMTTMISSSGRCGRPKTKKRLPARRHAGNLLSAPDYAHPLLAPLARAQHAVSRLDARTEAAAPVIAEGLRARLALREAAGWLAWARFSIHPRDLALRDAGLTGAYGPAALADRLAAELPATTAQGTIFELAPSDLAVDQALQHGPILAAAG